VTSEAQLGTGVSGRDAYAKVGGERMCGNLLELSIYYFLLGWKFFVIRPITKRQINKINC
jgi:hypothetical protein